MERLLTAYQEDLLSLDELRRRMPELRTREQSVRGGTAGNPRDHRAHGGGVESR